MVRFCLHQRSFTVKRLLPLAEKQNSTTNQRCWTPSSHDILQSHTGQETWTAYLRTSHSLFGSATLGQFLERSSPESAELLVVGLGPLVSLIRGLVVDVSRGSGIVIWVFFHHLQLGFNGTNLRINTLNSRGKKKGNLLIQFKWVTLVTRPFGKGVDENKNKSRRKKWRTNSKQGKREIGKMKGSWEVLSGNVPNLNVVGISSASLDEGSKLAGRFLSPLKGSNFWKTTNTHQDGYKTVCETLRQHALTGWLNLPGL